MFGNVLAVLYASLTRPTPRAAARTIVRSRPVIRDTSVATAIVPAARRIPPAAPGAPSRRSASSSVSASGPRGTGGRTEMTWVWLSSAAGTQRLRSGGSGGSGRAGGRGATGGGTGGWPSAPAREAGSPKDVDGGGAAR